MMPAIGLHLGALALDNLADLALGVMSKEGLWDPITHMTSKPVLYPWPPGEHYTAHAIPQMLI